MLEAELAIGGDDRSAAEGVFGTMIWEAYLGTVDKKEKKDLLGKQKRGESSVAKMGVQVSQSAWAHRDLP